LLGVTAGVSGAAGDVPLAWAVAVKALEATKAWVGVALVFTAALFRILVEKSTTPPTTTMITSPITTNSHLGRGRGIFTSLSELCEQYKEHGLMNTIPSYHEGLIKGPGEKAKNTEANQREAPLCSKHSVIYYCL
jgi:hypothetical protein